MENVSTSPIVAVAETSPTVFSNESSNILNSNQGILDFISMFRFLVFDVVVLLSHSLPQICLYSLFFRAAHQFSSLPGLLLIFIYSDQLLEEVKSACVQRQIQ